MEDVLIALAVGFAGGVAAGLLGIGGGAVFIPGMVFLLDREQNVAQGISLTVIVVTALVAGWKHSRHGNVDFQVARWMIPSAVALSVVGALLATQLSADVLRRIFGSFVLIVALRVLYEAITSWQTARVAARVTAMDGSNAASASSAASAANAEGAGGASTVGEGVAGEDGPSEGES